jgi:hypothetical protein
VQEAFPAYLPETVACVRSPIPALPMMQSHQALC